MDATWANNTIWWHVYPLGFTGAPIRDYSPEASARPRLRQLIDWLDYARELGFNGLLLGPIFESSTHGYDTLDHFHIDPRLGSDADFDALITACRERGIRAVLDGVFSHVGREHPLVRADLAGGPESASGLFDIDWSAEGGPRPRVWEGHESLVRFNHASDQARDYVHRVMTHWLDRGADGWRLDAAYSVPYEFWRQVLPSRDDYPHAWYLGEVLHGDYAHFVEESHVNTVTQYELWKSTWSSIKDRNFFELDWNLKRHNELLTRFTPNTFIGNHDVTRIASQVGGEGAVAALAILMTVGGIPSIYYGDEQGFTGVKHETWGGDDEVRPAYPARPEGLSPLGKPIYDAHRALISLRRQRPWLATAQTEVLELSNERIRYRSAARDAWQQDAWLEVEIDLTSGVHIEIRDAGGVFWSR